MPCWAAKRAIEISALSLAPLCAPQLVKPAVTLCDGHIALTHV
jgi:hypothetical protein